MSYARGTVRWLGSECPKAPKVFNARPGDEAALSAGEKSLADDVPFVLLGPVGCGKTTLMAHVFRGLEQRARAAGLRYRDRQYWVDEPCYWSQAEEYLDDVQRAYGFAKQFSDWGDAYSADGIARQCPRLFLDDVGIQGDARDSNFRTEEIGKLLRVRHDRGLPTWITSNLSWEQFRKRYGEAVASRLTERALLVRMAGSDRREALSARIRAGSSAVVA